MGNLWQSLKAITKSEKIEAVIIGPHDSDRWKDDGEEGHTKDPSMLNKLISSKEAKKILDYDYDSGFGGADCHPFHAWTATKVIYVHEYDGATHVTWLPRNPTIKRLPNFN